jgi:hypothetical protein
MRPHSLDLVVRNIDWALLREQKNYCLNESENSPTTEHIYNGIVNLMDALQDAAVEDGFATFEQVFGVEDDESNVEDGDSYEEAKLELRRES